MTVPKHLKSEQRNVWTPQREQGSKIRGGKAVMRLGSLNAASKAKTGDFFHFESAEKKKNNMHQGSNFKNTMEK